MPALGAGVSSGVTSGVSSGVTISYSEAVESGVAPPPRKRARVSAADAALMNSNAEFLARAAAVKLADERAVRRADAIICSGVRHNVSNATKSLVSHSFDVVIDTKTREQVAALSSSRSWPVYDQTSGGGGFTAANHGRQ